MANELDLDFPPGAVARVLYHAISPHQEITLTLERGGIIQLTLDGYWQFHSDDEHIYHETLADLPLALSPRIRKVAILGGGDGLALRNVLRYPIERAVLCELDERVIECTRTVSAMRSLSERSLDDPRAEVLIQDARAFVSDTNETFDVIISDFPASTRRELDHLFSHDLFLKASRILADDGILAIQVSQRPRRFWSIHARVAQLFDWVMPVLVEMGEGDNGEAYWANFLFASRSPRRPERPIAAGARFLTFERIPKLVISNYSREWFETLEHPEGPTLIRSASTRDDLLARSKTFGLTRQGRKTQAAAGPNVATFDPRGRRGAHRGAR